MGLDINFYKIKDYACFQKSRKAREIESAFADELEKKYKKEYTEYSKKWSIWWGNHGPNDPEPVIDFLTPEEDLTLHNNMTRTEFYEIKCGFDTMKEIDALYMRKQNWMVEFVNNIHPEYKNKDTGEIQNCDYVALTKDDINELISRMKKITDSTGWDFTKEIKWSRKPPKKSLELAKELLPTVSGFFYGDTDYSPHYFTSLYHYMITFSTFLQEDWADDEYLIYCANW